MMWPQPNDMWKLLVCSSAVRWSRHAACTTSIGGAQILKTDIEGFEWEVFDDFFARGETMPFSQILVRVICD